MTATSGEVRARGGPRAHLARLFRDYPLIPLIVLLVLLVVVSGSRRPGTVNASWAAFAARQAAVLAILAGSQTITMLTGGIDLSVGDVASMSGFVVATWVHQPGGWVAGVGVALAVAALAGLVNGVGVGVFKVHPLIVTLGMGLIVLGLVERLAARDGPDWQRCPGRDPRGWRGA